MPSLTTFALLSAATLAGTVLGHAVQIQPPPRVTGPQHEALCGAAVVKTLESDIAGPIENAMEVADADYNCDAYLCRGYQYEDNLDNVVQLAPGDVLNVKIDLIAGHRPGYSNFSVVDLATNTVIGSPLVTWANWPDSTSGPPRNDTNFNATIPSGLETACSEGGKCVLQWYWYATGNKQTYESCLDFYIGGNGGGNGGNSTVPSAKFRR